MENNHLCSLLTIHGVMMRDVSGNVIAWCRTEQALLSIVWFPPLTKQVQVPVIPLMIVKRCRQGLHLEMTVDTWASAVRDQYPLYRRDRARMAGCC